METETTDIIDDIIQRVYKMKNNFKNIEPFETVYDDKKKTNILKEGFEAAPPDNSFASLLPGEGEVKLAEMEMKVDALEKEYKSLVLANNGKVPKSKEIKTKIETAKKNWEVEKKLKDNFAKSIDKTVAFFHSLSPSIKYVKGKKPKMLAIIYMAVVVIFNIPNIIIQFASRILANILQNSDPSKPKTLKEEESDYELIRSFFVEASYLVLTFWMTFVLLDYGLAEEPAVKSIGYPTKFEYMSIEFVTRLFSFLWYPAELMIRLISTKVGPAFRTLGLDDYPSMKFLACFCFSIFFVFNFLSKCRSAFFKCFIRGEEMPKASPQVHLLIALGYLSTYLGVSLTNAAMWYLFTLGRLLTFIFHIIIAHLMAPIAQFWLTMALLWYFLLRYLPLVTPGLPISELYDKVAGGQEKTCKSDDSSFMGKVNHLFGKYLLQKSKKISSEGDWSCFFFFIWMLFFMYRMQKIEQTGDKNLRVLTGVFNGLGIFGCIAYILYIHVFGGSDNGKGKELVVNLI
jgi:hypothetical protein